MPTNNGWSKLLKVIPFGKLRRYEVANLTFDVIALYFTARFTVHQSSPMACMLLWAGVIALGFVCILWACKQ
jgi:hypothetical protein